ncbi:MAG TPA: M24 family metallopeptidase [Candidatus Xenobia bacterium]|nr:M24 family metallopeptidase [Candidatus Xenobia bacterium]
MAFNLEAIQAELRRRGFDGWLLYDHHHRDPIAYRVLDLEATMVTRRWYYFIPAAGAPRKLVHRIEAARLDALPGEKNVYAAWSEQREKLKAILDGAKKVAMQYSPYNNIFTVSMVDAGTVELVRSFGVEVVSSADLIQRFEACWTPEQYEMHREAGRRVDEVMLQSFARIAAHVRDGKPLSEYALQQWILEQFAARGLTTDEPPIVAWNQHSGDPHFSPRAEDTRSAQKGDWVLLDMWAKLAKPRAVFYDITWVGYVGSETPARYQEIFTIVREARDAACRFAAQALARGEIVYGYQVDDAARNLIRQRGYGDYFVHRTGHSIGEQVHSTGANMDNLETHDERELVPGLCFSVEPGIYLPEFGVRSEVNVFVGENSATITGPAQKEIVRILS